MTKTHILFNVLMHRIQDKTMKKDLDSKNLFGPFLEPIFSAIECFRTKHISYCSKKVILSFRPKHFHPRYFSQNEFYSSNFCGLKIFGPSLLHDPRYFETLNFLTILLKNSDKVW